MSNRRLDISSLLCNDDDVPPHRPRPTPAPPSSSSTPSKPPFLGFQALVHVATEEHRRLSGGSESVPSRHDSPVEDHPQRIYSYQPTHQVHQTSPKQVYAPVLSSPVHPQSPTYPSYPQRPREHVQVFQSPIEQRSPVSPYVRPEEEPQRYQYLQRQRQEAMLQDQRSHQRPQHFLQQPAPYVDGSRTVLPPVRSPSMPLQVEDPEQLHSRASPLSGRPRSGSFVPKYPMSPMQVDMPTPTTIPRGSPHLPTPITRELPVAPPINSPTILREPVTPSPREFQPTFFHDPTTFYRRDSPSTLVRDIQSPSHQTAGTPYTSHSPHQVASIPYNSHSPHLAASVPPSSHSPHLAASVPSSSHSPHPAVSIPSSSHSPQQAASTAYTSYSPHPRAILNDDLPPNKRRRHSDSPLRLPAIVHDLDLGEPTRIREQRLDVGPSEPVELPPQPLHTVPPPIAAAPGPVIIPRKPSYEEAKKTLSPSETQVKERELHKVASTLGRRSPPGSAVGRAKAAKKIDEIERNLREANRKDSIPSPVAMKPRDEVLQPAPVSGAAIVLESKRQEAQEISPAQISHANLIPSSFVDKQDSHERLVKQFDKQPSPPAPRHSKRATSLRPDTVKAVPSSPSSPSLILANSHPPSPPHMSEEAVATLEQELEELLAEPEGLEENKMDVDIDRDVMQLVAETLDNGEAEGGEEGRHPSKNESLESETDVDLELLRLVDDQPPDSAANGPPTQVLDGARKTASPVVRPIKPSSPDVPYAVMATLPDTMSTLDHGPMPPPASHAAIVKVKDQGRPMEDNSVVKKANKPSGGSKKKESTIKPSKPKIAGATAKPKAKSTTKPKTKATEGTTTPPLAAPKPGKVHIPPPVKKSASSTAASRSRSASVMPTGSVGPEGEGRTAERQEEEESSDAANEEDKLYCVCKTKYDEERFMIACDMCDEWYHMQCVEVSELEVDLVDQFFCPTCIDRNSQVSLRTTYKQRCLNGLKHSDPISPDTCHRPALGGGILSKFCSQDCGVEYMTNRIDIWVKKGGKREKLWESVKRAEKREGVVIQVGGPKHFFAEMTFKTEDVKPMITENQSEIETKHSTDKSQVNAAKSPLEIDRLRSILAHVVKMREEIKKGMEVVLWRERLLELATERALTVEQCGWDQRLCFGDEEWAEFGMGVLESYEAKEGSAAEEESLMQIDGGNATEDGEWWCPGKIMCDRHAGWQNIRAKDISKEKEQKEEALSRLTTRERELRKRIEDLVDPHARDVQETPSKKSVKLSNHNGHISKTGGFVQKGKKRKAIVH